MAFTGFAFSATADGPLPNALLSIPLILFESLDGQCSATLSIPAGRLQNAIAEWRQALDKLPPAKDCRPSALLPGAGEMLADQAWIARCQAALRAIADGRAEKLVLTRSRRIESRQQLAPVLIMSQLLRQQSDSLCYAFGNGQQVFLGATPERLVRLRHGQVDADALAGTAWADSAALAGAKNRHEQSLVVRAVCAALAPLVTTPPASSPPLEHAAGHLRHLRSRITATARPDTSLFDLIAALHPTPAVGGYPGAAALAWLEAHGERRNGWYSGGIGYMDQDGDGEISVALRSALIDGRTAILQAGAGIVAGSDPANELAETEAKLATITAALQAVDSQPGEATGTR
ncbi:MAG: isochorismate synthase [Dechloromonas sp.]|nr:MAG: isochorismate synthase [Dechloromonas sp.]